MAEKPVDWTLSLKVNSPPPAAVPSDVPVNQGSPATAVPSAVHQGAVPSAVHQGAVPTAVHQGAVPTAVHQGLPVPTAVHQGLPAPPAPAAVNYANAGLYFNFGEEFSVLFPVRTARVFYFANGFIGVDIQPYGLHTLRYSFLWANLAVPDTFVPSLPPPPPPFAAVPQTGISQIQYGAYLSRSDGSIQFGVPIDATAYHYQNNRTFVQERFGSEPRRVFSMDTPHFHQSYRAPNPNNGDGLANGPAAAPTHAYGPAAHNGYRNPAPGNLNPGLFPPAHNGGYRNPAPGNLNPGLFPPAHNGGYRYPAPGNLNPGLFPPAHNGGYRYPAPGNLLFPPARNGGYRNPATGNLNPGLFPPHGYPNPPGNGSRLLPPAAGNPNQGASPHGNPKPRLFPFF